MHYSKSKIYFFSDGLVMKLFGPYLVPIPRENEQKEIPALLDHKGFCRLQNTGEPHVSDAFKIPLLSEWFSAVNAKLPQEPRFDQWSHGLIHR